MTNDHTTCPKSDKSISMLPLPVAAQNPPQVDFEATSKINPKKMFKINSFKEKDLWLKPAVSGVVYLLGKYAL